MTMGAPFDEFIAEFNQKNKCSPRIYRTDPFPYAAYDSIGENLTPILKHLDSMEYGERYTDLYKMYQTKEMQHKDICDSVSEIFPKLNTQGVEVTGVYLSSQIYRKGSYLLCHDDQLDDRLFAFVFYVHTMADVSLEDGGTLDLFQVNALQEPHLVISQIIPQKYSLALFEVSPRSFHQVSEVLSEDFLRRSIGGWIRGRYKFPETAVPQKLEFSQLKSSLEQLSLDDVTEYFVLDSKYGIVECGIPFKDVPMMYFFIEVLYFDESSFCMDFKLEPRADYYVHCRELPGDRLRTCKLVECPEGFRKVKESVISIPPGEGTFFMLKCNKR